MEIEITPDDGSDNTYRRKIVSSKVVPGTKSGRYVTLECNHVVMIFGTFQIPNGVICDRCKKAAPTK